MRRETSKSYPVTDSASSNQLCELFHLLDDRNDHEIVALLSPEAIFQDYLESPLLDWLRDQEIRRAFLHALANHPDQVQTLGDALSHPLPDHALYSEITRVAKDKLKRDQLSPNGKDAIRTLYLLVKATEYQVRQNSGNRKLSRAVVRGWGWIRSDVDWLPEAYKMTIMTVLMEEEARKGECRSMK